MRERNFLTRAFELFRVGVESQWNIKKKLKIDHILPGYEKIPCKFMPSINLYMFFKKCSFTKNEKIYLENKTQKKGPMTFIDGKLPPLEQHLQKKRDSKSIIYYIVE